MSGQETSDEVVESVVGRGALLDDTHAVFGPIRNKRIGPCPSAGASQSRGAPRPERLREGKMIREGKPEGRRFVRTNPYLASTQPRCGLVSRGLARMRPLGATGASPARARDGRKVPVARFARRGRRERRRSGEATSGSLGACRSESEGGVMARDAEPSNAGRAGGGPRLRGPEHRAVGAIPAWGRMAG